jgi:hypothetical protein
MQFKITFLVQENKHENPMQMMVYLTVANFTHAN